jgi:glutamine cyclotransferase
VIPLKKNPCINFSTFLPAFFAAVLFFCGLSSAKEDASSRPETPLYTYRIVKSYPHDPSAFTQGLFFYKGYLYESTGLYGRSSLRKVKPETGKVIRIKRFPKTIFGEGIARWGNQIVMLTWQSKEGFLFDIDTFRQTGQFRYTTEGWGITSDGTRLLMSDGTSMLQFLEPGTFKMVKKIAVGDRGKPVIHLNELEYVKGEIYANIWRTGYIARISPDSGEVKGWIDLRGLYAELGSPGQADVLNGIAYDPEKDRIFVTGKYWPKLFEIRISSP